MTASGKCGARSLLFVNMGHRLRAIDAILADGTAALFAEVPGNFGPDDGVPADGEGEAAPERYRDLVRDMRALHRREKGEIERRFPKVQRRVGGYNIDIIDDAG